jgi:hypothetical protein
VYLPKLLFEAPLLCQVPQRFLYAVHRRPEHQIAHDQQHLEREGAAQYRERHQKEPVFGNRGRVQLMSRMHDNRSSTQHHAPDVEFSDGSVEALSAPTGACMWL